MNFFKDPPAISWLTWIQRRIWSINKEPALINYTLSPNNILQNGLKKPTKCLPSSAPEYSKFLVKYYSTEILLYIPQEMLQYYLNHNLIGVEVRTDDNALVGLVFSWYTGLYNDINTRLITWLCIHPSWRKKGVTDSLLYTMQKVCLPHTVHFFRNDGWLKSPLPPLWTDIKIARKRLEKYITTVERVSLDSKRKIISDFWKKKNPNGILLDDVLNINPLIEVWEYKPTNMILILQPTFENEPYSNKRWCEIMFWVCGNTYDCAMAVEIIIDALPYDLIEAPSTIPHLDGWNTVGQSSWSVYGLDQGSPVMRPVLSLIAN